MSRTLAGLVAGALGGAAGATALNAVAYLDQAVRGRAGDDTPKKTVSALSDAIGVDVPGHGATRDNRLEGLGPLAGLAVGVGVGALSGVLRAYGVKVPKPLSAIVVGFGAMAISDSVMAALGVADPRSWTVESVAADALPHLVYGAITNAAIHRMLDPRTPQVV